MLSNMAGLYHERGEVETARGFLERAVELFEGEDNLKNLAVALGNLGTLYFDSGQFEEARSVLEECRRLCQQSGWKMGEGSFLPVFASLEMEAENYEEAAALLETAEPILRAAQNQMELVKCLLRKGELQRLTGQLKGAEETLKEAEAIGVRLAFAPDSAIARGLKALEQRIRG